MQIKNLRDSMNIEKRRKVKGGNRLESDSIPSGNYSIGREVIGLPSMVIAMSGNGKFLITGDRLLIDRR